MLTLMNIEKNILYSIGRKFGSNLSQIFGEARFKYNTNNSNSINLQRNLWTLGRGSK